MDPSGAVVKDIAVVLRPTAKYRERIALSQRNIADQEARLGTRRALQHNGDSTKW